MTETIDLNPADIIVADDRIRPLDRGVVAFLADDIREKGLLQPIGVRAERRFSDGEHFLEHHLVYGEHRLVAMLGLKRDTISCVSLDVDKETAKLMEIDENLVRSELKPLEFAKALFERKAAYEAVYPETVHGARGLVAIAADTEAKSDFERGLHMQQAVDPSRQFGDLGDDGRPVRFTMAAASRLGISERQVQRRVKMWNGLTSDSRRRILASTRPYSYVASEIEAIVKAGTEDQPEIIDHLESGNFEKVADAVLDLQGESPAANRNDRQYDDVIKRWERANATAKKRVFQTISPPEGFLVVHPDGYVRDSFGNMRHVSSMSPEEFGEEENPLRPRSADEGAAT